MAETKHVFDGPSAKRIAEAVRYVERMMANGQQKTIYRDRKYPRDYGIRYVKLTQDLYKDASFLGTNAVLCDFEGTEDDPQTEVAVRMDYRHGYWFTDDVVEVRRIGQDLQVVQDGYVYFGGLTNTATAISSGSSASRTIHNTNSVTVYSPYGALGASKKYAVHWSPDLTRWEAIAAECA